MKNLPIKLFLPFILLFFVSCTLEGVKKDDDLSLQDDGYNPLIDSTLIEIIEVDPIILPDSIDGKPNDLVWMGKNGLRIEWKEKMNAPILLNEVVLVNYHARVAGGEEYDNNDKIGKPVPLKTNIGMLIPGWEEALLHMNIGDKGRILIPNALAYGENGYSTVVPPNADIIVEIEIMSRVEPIIHEEGVKVYIWDDVKEGDKALKGQTIAFDYFAYTMGENAKMYDNSYQNGEAFFMKFENDNVVEGLHQGMSFLTAGDKAFIEIPANLAYGKSGLLDLVPKNTSIVYDVRLLSIK